MKALVFDTETTGFIKHPNAKPDLQPKIIEFGGVLIDTNGKELQVIDTLINPERSIPEAASKVNGIYDKDVKGAPLFKDVVNDIAKIFKKADIMIAHNLPFDYGMMILELGLKGTVDFPWPQLNMCTVAENQGFMGYRMKLSDLYESVTGKKLEQTHRAIDDARALTEIVIAGKYLERFIAAN